MKELEFNFSKSAFTPSISADEFFSIQSVGAEYNQLVLLMGYWNDLRGDYFAPNYADFEISSLDYEIIPNSAVVDVLPNEDDFIYRFLGTGFVDMSKLEMTGKNVKGLLPKELSVAAYDAYKAVLELRAPTISLGATG
ncbi:MAG: hypothetical protein HOE97_00040 [Rhodospirillaceae bacterium]|nr:hypothetical protein [Rhodospirillaceae bacterium]